MIGSGQHIEGFDVVTRGQWLPGQIRVTWATTSSRAIVKEVEAQIERAWRDAEARLGEKLFDGPMCRLERWSCDASELHLHLSKTSYRAFLGTSLTGQANELLARFGDVLARPVGISAAVISADGHLLLGRRNDSVAYYPHRLHPFAGSLEPRESLDVFDDVLRELAEELSLARNDVSSIECNGIVEDQTLRQPEMIFTVRTSRPLVELQSQVARHEHRESWSCPATADAIAAALADASLPFTPVARAAMRWCSIDESVRGSELGIEKY